MLLRITKLLFPGQGCKTESAEVRVTLSQHPLGMGWGAYEPVLANELQEEISGECLWLDLFRDAKRRFLIKSPPLFFAALATSCFLPLCVAQVLGAVATFLHNDVASAKAKGY